MRTRLWTSCLAAALAATLTACPPPEVEPEPDAGEPRPDACNSLEEALGDPQCELTLGGDRKAYLSFAGDQDWYTFRTPADANARTLIHLSGGYGVPNTAVNLSLNLLREDGNQSLARQSDRHGQAAPRPVDIVLPFAEANQRLVVLVTDDPVNPSKPNFDVRAEYNLKVEVVQDPDVNEPNDSTPTAIPLTPQGPALQGTQTGFLSTANDVDRFSIDVPAGKKVLYLAVTAPELSPPPPFRLQYELLDPSGTRIAEGLVQNAFLAPNLATARLSKMAGQYTVVVRGYLSTDTTQPVPGDLRLQYTVDARLFDEVDATEGGAQNDTLETATPIAFTSPGETQTRTARLGYVPDPDWFVVNLPAHSQPTVLRYRVRPSGAPGRFPALPGVLDRELRVVRLVQTGGTAQDDVTACRTNSQICPRSFGNDPFLSGLHTELCQQHTPPRCLWSMRDEHVSFDSLRNFEGAIPIPAHSATVAMYLLVQDEQNNWADDSDYTLELEWRADPDDTARLQGGVEVPESKPLAADLAASTYPVPPTGSAFEVSGRLSHGYAFLRDHDPNQGEGVRGPTDYDAVTSDRDRYQFLLPALDPDAGYLDRGWELEWSVDKTGDGGTAPYDLALELEFCDGDRLDGGVCTPVKTSSSGDSLTLSYTGAARNAWHNPGAPAADRQPLYERTETNAEVITTARAYGCNCFEPRFIKGGTFYLTVLAVDRRGYADVPYTIRTAYTDYPKTYVAPQGNIVSCPQPGPDAGCQFTRDP